jgi:predicted aldo/keto reductase-like oxidoreductase
VLSQGTNTVIPERVSNSVSMLESLNSSAAMNISWCASSNRILVRLKGVADDDKKINITKQIVKHICEEGVK